MSARWEVASREPLASFRHARSTEPARFGEKCAETHPKMTACHDMMSLPTGAALIPDGGSFVNLLKSRINLFFAVPVAMENKGACFHMQARMF